MLLALVGSGEYLPPIEPVDRDLISRLPAPARVACLPTAAGAEGQERIDYWSNLGLEHFKRLGVSVEALPVVDRPSANDPRLAERLSQANFVYFSGGRPDYLLNCLKDSLVYQVIMEILARGGLLAGCSAGAMILGERIPVFPGWRKAFNLVQDRVIVPHFDEIPPAFTRTFKMFVGRARTLVGIDDSTALVIEQGIYRVGIGDLQGIIERLDHLNDGDPSTTTDLGVTGLWLMPIHPSPSYHGYDVTDYYAVHPDYRTREDFRRLVAECHRRGIRVLVDLVLNHSSSQHPNFEAALRGDPAWRDWYIFVPPDRVPQARGPWGQQVWQQMNGQHYYGIFWSGMPDLNYRNPAVTAEAYRIAEFWLRDVGVDGLGRVQRRDATAVICQARR